MPFLDEMRIIYMYLSGGRSVILADESLSPLDVDVDVVVVPPDINVFFSNFNLQNAITPLKKLNEVVLPDFKNRVGVTFITEIGVVPVSPILLYAAVIG
jgi:hypothetical protein